MGGGLNSLMSGGKTDGWPCRPTDRRFLLLLLLLLLPRRRLGWLGRMGGREGGREADHSTGGGGVLQA